MKAAAFDYARPSSLAEVLHLLAEHGDQARVLAGGQTLLATLNMRLSDPSLLIDIGGIESLKGISVQGDALRVGATVTHSEIESSALVARHAPLLAMAVPHIGHRAIRNLGTFGGSIAYADPAAEWPACLLALDGIVVAQGPKGERRIAARDFFVDLYTTALAPGEIVSACEMPLATASDVFGFDELSRRHGDYAIVGVAMSARRGAAGSAASSSSTPRIEPRLDEPHDDDMLHARVSTDDAAGLRADLDSFRLQHVRLAFLGIGTIPVRAAATEALFEGRVATQALIDEAVETLRGELDPLPDLTHSPATKRHLASVLARRVLSARLLG